MGAFDSFAPNGKSPFRCLLDCTLTNWFEMMCLAFALCFALIRVATVELWLVSLLSALIYRAGVIDCGKSFSR